MFEITIKIHTVVSGTAVKKDYCYRQGRGGGGQRVMIEIIISVNDENDGRHLTHFEAMDKNYLMITII